MRSITTRTGNTRKRQSGPDGGRCVSIHEPLQGERGVDGGEDLARAAQRAAELRAILERANYEYWVLEAPTLSDPEYDRLFRELKALEQRHPELVTPDSPTQRVGAEPVSQLEKVRHLSPMYSLDNAFDADDLRAWEDRNARLVAETRTAGYVAEEKIDGLAVSLLYENG